jgi:hypothetical protein
MSFASGQSVPSHETFPKQYKSEHDRFIALTLALPAVVVLCNFLIGVMTPITLWPEDDIMLTDTVWRVVQGQRLGIDFQDVLGFGPSQVAAVLWRLFGPHYYLLRASNSLIALAIVVLGCAVAVRRLRNRLSLAVLFCVTVAVEATASSIYNLPHQFGMAVSYDRLTVASLSVLFVLSFAKSTNWHRWYVDCLVAALLLDILFLVKISGFAFGLAIVVGGCFVQGNYLRGARSVILTVLILAGLLVGDFISTGTDLIAIIQQYRLAAQARVAPYSVSDGLWFASRSTVLGMAALMVFYAVSPPEKMEKESLWRCFLIILAFWGCQVALNMTNRISFIEFNIYLAPAAIVAVVTWVDGFVPGAWDPLWPKLHLRSLHAISLREVVPPLIVGLVLVPQGISAIRALKLDYSIRSSRSSELISVKANKGIQFDVFPLDPTSTYYVRPINSAVEAIDKLGATREIIVNLDFTNPFPALFLAPDPMGKGVRAWWDFKVNVPADYKPTWQEVMGNACMVTEPKYLATSPNTRPLVEAVKSRLTTAFTIVYENDWWRIWKSNGDCEEKSAS